MHSWYIFWALLRRDLKIISFNIKSRFVDGILLLTSQVIGFGYLLPLAGMPTALVAPVFLGIVTRIFFFLGYGFSMQRVFDLQQQRIIDYHLTLPFSLSFLIAEYIAGFIIEALLISLPLVIFGILLLGPIFPTEQISWLSFIIMYSLILIFYGLLFSYLGFANSYTWFLDNIWARRLTPLLFLGCSFFSWKETYEFSPFFGIVFLLNPITYTNEGLRACLLGQKGYLPLWISASVIICATIMLFFLLKAAIKKRLDPV
jgi:hypothetical protein